MTLHIHTARISYRGPDRLDITRGSGGEAGHPFAPSWGIVMAVKRGHITWREYSRLYHDEMVESQRRHPDAWSALLARDRVCLICYCPRRERCHRGLLAAILAQHGAIDEGEVPTRPQHGR